MAFENDEAFNKAINKASLAGETRKPSGTTKPDSDERPFSSLTIAEMGDVILQRISAQKKAEAEKAEKERKEAEKDKEEKSKSTEK